MERIAIITDSTCDASDEELRAIDVHCIQLKVIKPDGTVFPSGNSPENQEAFYDYIETCEELPGTSMPSPVEFANLYGNLAEEGYTSILSVHISSSMSGTCTAARLGAQSSPIPVAVIDSRRTTWALMLIVKRLAQLRDEGMGFEALAAKAEELPDKVNICFVLDTLRNLVKGGRTGRAAGLAAAILDIKPLLTMNEEGEVGVVGKVRSMKRALPKLADEAENLITRLGSLEGYFVHVRNPIDVEALREVFKGRGVAFGDFGTRQVGPVVATHVGVGCVGFAYIPIEA